MTLLALVTACVHVSPPLNHRCWPPEALAAARIAVRVESAAREVAKDQWGVGSIDANDIVLIGSDWAVQLAGIPYAGMHPLGNAHRCPCVASVRGPPNRSIDSETWRWSKQSGIPFPWARGDQFSNESAIFLAEGGWMPTVIPWHGFFPPGFALAWTVFGNTAALADAKRGSYLDSSIFLAKHPPDREVVALQLEEQHVLAQALRSRGEARRSALCLWRRIRGTLRDQVPSAEETDELDNGLSMLFALQTEAQRTHSAWNLVEVRIAQLLEQRGRDLAPWPWFADERSWTVGSALLALLDDGGKEWPAKLVKLHGNTPLDRLLADQMGPSGPSHEREATSRNFVPPGAFSATAALRVVGEYEWRRSVARQASLHVTIIKDRRAGRGSFLFSSLGSRVANISGAQIIRCTGTLWAAGHLVRLTGLVRVKHRAIELLIEGPLAAAVTVSAFRQFDGRRGRVNVSTPQLEVHSEDAEVHLEPRTVRIALGPGLGASAKL